MNSRDKEANTDGERRQFRLGLGTALCTIELLNSDGINLVFTRCALRLSILEREFRDKGRCARESYYLD